jgi:hypothetical protein
MADLRLRPKSRREATYPTGGHMSNSTLYDRDFYAWSQQQAELLRTGKFTEADIPNIIEEIETLGRSEMRELVNRLRVLLHHLLKWQYQPNLQGSSWRATIAVQRHELTEHLNESPSLKSRLAEAMARAYRLAVTEVIMETGLTKQTFPVACPWSYDEIMDENFWP